MNHVQTEPRFQQVITATREQSGEMLSRPKDKRPYPATWLNGERWEDETQGAPQQEITGGPRYRRWDPPPAVQND